jgi:hypothetical protein
MQEDLTQHTLNAGKKTVTLALTAVEFTAELLAKAMRALIGGKTSTETTDVTVTKEGKQSLKSLVKQGDSLSEIEITDKNIGSFERTAKKYGIDFSLRKDKNADPPVFMAFFKAKDTDVMNAAFKEYANKTLRKEQKKEKAAEKPSLADRLKETIEKATELAKDKKEKNLTKPAPER